MTSRTVKFRSLGELTSLSSSITNDLISSTRKIPKLLGHQVSLIEIFTHESKKLEMLGYCDYELALVSFDASVALYKFCEKAVTIETKGFLDDIKVTLASKRSKYEHLMESFSRTPKTEDSNDTNGSVDPLLARFNNLKSPSPLESEDGPQGSHTEVINIDTFKYKEFINPAELHELLFLEGYSSKSILLIDYRTRKEFNYNHINYSEIVNIEPDWVNSLLGSLKEAHDILDQTLEARLEMLLPSEQYKRFLKRFTYDLVVVYNLRYGPGIEDRFMSLKNLLINGDSNGIAVQCPIQKLIDIITYKNKYISSKLKRHPCILAGGVKAWYDMFGEKYIMKTNTPQILARPEASLSRGGSESSIPRRNNNKTPEEAINPERSSSPYLKNFGEYLSTAKSTNTPISNSFSPSTLMAATTSNINSNTSSSIQNSTNLRSSSLGSSFIDSEKLNSSPPQQQKPKLVTSSPRRESNSSVSNLSQSFTNSLSSSKSSSTNEIPFTSKNNNTIKFLEQYTTGLTNLGNSCYMNCILQCLAATPQLTKFFFPNISSSSLPSSSSLQSYRQHINVNNKLGSKGILTTNFVNLLMNMFTNVGKYFTPTSFKKVVGSLSPGQQFATFDQQDCIEFLNFILDGLHEDLNQMLISDPEEKKTILELTPEQEKTREFLPVRLASTIEWERYLKLNFSIIVDFFQGQYLSQLKCLECGLTSTTYNAFLILSLPIPEKLGSLKDVLLHDCLEGFVTTELLDDDNKWHCPSCKRFTKLTKKITITRLPQVLIIHFKRFKINNNGYFNKLDTFINYPVNDVLDLTSYWPDVGTLVNSNLKSNEKISKEKEKQILSTLPTRNQQPPFRYKLYGVANHFGNLSTGHYTSYVYKQSDSKKTRDWCYFDDAKVTYNCKESQVLNRNAYCLFYQRI
ncbi:unnamed protein product [Debaryomyces tyrocola]|nr:unnamed protein product [Debaryomyces tyrocola]